MKFYTQANKTNFYMKGFALCLILKVRVVGTWKWPILGSNCCKIKLSYIFLFFYHPKIYQIQQHPHTGVTAVAVAAPQGTFIQQQGSAQEQATLAANEPPQQQ